MHSFPLNAAWQSLGPIQRFSVFWYNFSTLIKNNPKENNLYKAGLVRFGLLICIGAATDSKISLEIWSSTTLNNHKVNFCWEVSIKNFRLDFLNFLAFAFPRLENQAQKTLPNFTRFTYKRWVNPSFFKVPGLQEGDLPHHL